MPRITERFVRAAKPRKHKYEVCCTALRGLVLRVLPSGKKVYCVRIREGDKDIRVRLGSVEGMTLEQAQSRARELLYAPPAKRSANNRRKRSTSRSTRARGRRNTITVRTFAARYLTEHVDLRLKPNTRVKYRGHLKHIERGFGDLALQTVTREQVEAWHASMRDRPSAANNALRVLSHMYTKARDWGVIPREHWSPTSGVRLYRERRCERFLTPDERRRLERVLRDGESRPPGSKGHVRWATAAVIRLLSLTGMRRAEVLGLRWSMVDYRHRCLRLPESKTGQKVVPVGTPVLELLRALERRRLTGAPFVAYSSRGTRIHEASIGRAWRAIRTRAGLPDVRLHDLRHSAASDALMSGIPLAVVGKILGHRQPSTTARYAHIADSVLGDAVERMAISIAESVKPAPK